MSDRRNSPIMISIVVAISKNGVIGKDGHLPWHLPRDLKKFREITWGKPIVMGRKTHESIGKPLPGRPNLVLTRQADFQAEGCHVVHSVEEAIETAINLGASDLMVIGGQHLYEAFLPMSRTVYLTRVEADFEGDTYFPGESFSPADWKIEHEEGWEPDARNPFRATYQILTRREGSAA